MKHETIRWGLISGQVLNAPEGRVPPFIMPEIYTPGGLGRPSSELSDLFIRSNGSS